MSKKISQLDPATDAEVANDSYLFAIADPTNGIAKKATVAQVKDAYGAKSLKYKAVGNEGVSLTIALLEGVNILAILRSSGPIYLADGMTPDSDEYTWDQVTITLGTQVNSNEKFLIIYCNF